MTWEGIDNFRDFGAVAAKPGRLFRSAHLANATASDIAALKALDLAAIIDLRRPTERAQRPSPPDLAHLIVASDDDDRAEAPHLEFLRQGNTSDEAVHAFLLDYYRKAPFELRHRTLFAAAFRAMPDGPILIHCTAGKDRTGILAALILRHLGAGEDAIVQDFLRTNDAMLCEPHLGKAAQVAGQLLGREPSAAILKAMLGVEPEHLEASFASIHQRFPEFLRYLDWLRSDSCSSDLIHC